MIPLTLGEVAHLVGGCLYGADPGTPVTAPVEFDSRRVRPGGLFVALAGARADGHRFTSDASAAGAAASLVTRLVDGPVILVGDACAALARLAGEVVRRLPEVTTVGITGSSGKTSTKDVTAQLLARLGPTVASPASFNNELGYPYTVLRADDLTRYLVLETSARGLGHIGHLTGIARPRIGVVLNVGSAHLGEFGSRDVIARAKGELVEALPAGGLALLNADDWRVMGMADRTAARVATFGLAPGADVRATEVAVDHLARASYRLQAGGASALVCLRLVGAHQVANSLAAAAVALECGMGLSEVAEGLSLARPVSRWRMELCERADGVLIVNDAYNANPESVRAALSALDTVARGRSGRSFAVLGPMAELGEASDAEHAAIGRLVGRSPVSRLVVFGDGARPIERGAAQAGPWAGEATWVPDTDAAVALVQAELRPGDVVLVKASRAASGDRVASALLDHCARTADVGSDGPPTGRSH